MRRNKYGAKKVIVDGIRFDSKHEARCYQDLKLLEHAGKISELLLQVPFTLTCNDKPLVIRSERYPNGRKIKYIADFMYFDEVARETIIADAKGYRTKDYKLKRAIMETMGFDIVEL